MFNGTWPLICQSEIFQSLGNLPNLAPSQNFLLHGIGSGIVLVTYIGYKFISIEIMRLLKFNVFIIFSYSIFNKLLKMARHIDAQGK